MATIEIVRGFSHLFHGRHDAWFESLPKGGRCVRGPVTLELYRQHLSGAKEIGTYPVTDDARCRWSCIDIDKDDWQLATDVWSLWRDYGITAWIESSRSKGWHIWVFADTWIPAIEMRQAGQWIIEVSQNGPRPLDRKTEVNPKNDAPWLVPNGLVNTVRLPYSGRAFKDRMVMHESGTGLVIPLGTFVQEAMAGATDRLSIQRLSNEQARKRERERMLQTIAQLSATNGRIATRGNPASQEAAAILRGERRIKEGERDNQFYTLANLMRSLGYSHETAKATIARLHATMTDEAWSYPLENALEKVDRAY